MGNNKARRPEGQVGVNLDDYRRSVNKYGLWVLAANLLVMLAAAAGFGSSFTAAAGLGVVFLAIPAALHLLRVNALVASI